MMRSAFVSGEGSALSDASSGGETTTSNSFIRYYRSRVVNWGNVIGLTNTIQDASSPQLRQEIYPSSTTPKRSNPLESNVSTYYHVHDTDLGTDETSHDLPSVEGLNPAISVSRVSLENSENFPSPPTVHRMPRGRQLSAVVSPNPERVYATPPPLSRTQLALITPTGLKIWEHYSDGRVSDSTRDLSPEQEQYPSAETGGDLYDCDEMMTGDHFRRLRDHLKLCYRVRVCEARSTILPTNSASFPTKDAAHEADVTAYLHQQPLNNLDGPEVRVLILAGHDDDEEGREWLQVGKNTYRWAKLRTALRNVPNGVVVVVVLACCHAGNVMHEIVSEVAPNTDGGIYVLSATPQRNEDRKFTTEATTLIGTHFLDAFFEVLQHHKPSEAVGFNNWDSFLELVVKEYKLQTRQEDEDPTHYVEINENITPAVVFKNLAFIMPPSPPTASPPPLFKRGVRHATEEVIHEDTPLDSRV